MKAYVRFLMASVATLAFGGGQAISAERIGAAAAVKNQATGTLDSKTRILKAGLGIFLKERIDTSARSRAQLIFNDETALTVGPNSSVTLDEFVYDPKNNTGKTVINATKGAFRFVSGSVDPRSYEIRTPVGTMGVRGTIVDFFFLAGGALVMILVEGAMSFKPPGGPIVNVTKPRNFIVVTTSGKVSKPAPWRGSISAIGGNSGSPLFGGQWVGNANPTFNFPYSMRDINTAVTGNVAPSSEDGSPGYCWVARAVYGEDDPRWRHFRAWLLAESPTWFRALYIRHGERFSGWLAGRTRIKLMIRQWMDQRIAGRDRRMKRA
ncbi:MAG: FecR domain-containing protein [Alphaproteobacteria bacterium]|nr:FecR domain-containing protein [Alphaproteobacteria bacterium]